VIRRLLTEGAVRASDKRARFIGEAYEAEGGSVLRDLFQGDDGGWLQDVALADRLVAERLEREAETVRAEGWKWIEVAPDFPYGHSFGLRQLRGEEQPLTAEQAGSAKSGILANAAAGAVEGGSDILNVISDPFGNLIGKPSPWPG